MELPKGWTEAKFNGFIRSALRTTSMKWPPKHEVLKKARVERGKYFCAGCNQIVPASLPKPEGKTRRPRNVFVDHIEPIIDPYIGFVSWDEVISRMFVTEKHLQVLCKLCHDAKTQEERRISRERRKKK